MIMKRRASLQLIGGGFVFAAVPALTACSSDLPAQALVAWQGPGDEPDLRKWMLGYAILAPNSHNLQSWRVDLRQEGLITLYCDTNRLLPETDPFSRQILMAQGTFLELLDMAAREKGFRADIHLFPDGEFGPQAVDQRPVAQIRLRADASVPKDPLFAQILKRHTNREAYEATAIEAGAVTAIQASVASPGMRVGVVGQGDALQQHRAIAKEAWRIELTTPRTILESFKVLRLGPDEIAQHRDGISVNAPIVRALVSLGLFDRSKAPAPDDMAVTGEIKKFNTHIDSTGAFFWLITDGNDRKTQVNAGRAYVRAQLAATALGLSMHPLSQALQEYPEQAKPYADIHRLLGADPSRQTVQLWARLGYAPQVQASPRRGVASHLIGA
jgi:nitroreductase